MKIRPVGVELFHADGQTYMKLFVPFRNSANAPIKKKACECITKHLFPLQFFRSSFIIYLTNFCNRNPNIRAAGYAALETGQPVRLLLLLQQTNAQK